jgi:hypothetical protein
MRPPQGLLLMVLTGVLWAAGVKAEPQRVRLPEGNAHGFLVIRTLTGDTLGYGELVQKPTRGLLTSRLRLHFTDGSLYDETVTFSQQTVFRLDSYRLVQHGPSLPKSDIAFDRKSSQYHVRQQDKPDGEEHTASGRLEMPPDLYNGMASTLIKNLPRGTSATVQYVAFTPEPRLLSMTLQPEGEEPGRVGKEAKPVTRYLVKLDIGGLAGLVAPVLGKQPPDLRYWLGAGDVPTFVRFEGPMFQHGPVWRLEQTTVQLPH